MTQQKPNLKISYVDLPELSETFADSIEKINFDGKTWRFEFCVTRMGQPIPPNTMVGTKYPACRLVLSIEAGLDLANKMNELISILEKQGAIKRVTNPNMQPPPGSKPN